MSGPEPGDALDGLRAENERLRLEIDRLRGRASASGPAAGDARRHRRTRWAAAIVLLALGLLLTPVAGVAVWARNAVFDTDRYVATVAPLARDPVIQDAIAARITTEVFRAVDVDELVDRSVDFLAEQGAPEQVALLADPVKKGLRSFATDQVRTVVRSEQFARAWDEANRVAHAGLVGALTGEGSGGVTISGETVSVNLGAFIAAIRPQLAEAGFPLADRIPQVNVSFTILESEQLPRIQRAARALDALALPLALTAIALLALGVLIAPDRRRMLLAAGLGIAVAMTVLLAVLTATREFYLTHLPAGTQSVDAAAVIWDTMLRYLVSGARDGIWVGLVIAVVAWLAGPAGPAVALRRLVATGAAFAWTWIQRGWHRLARSARSGRSADAGRSAAG
jgi:hypothetical protein